MKHCPVCNRNYPDDAQNFCLDDGTTLVSAGASSQNSYVNRSAPTEVMSPAPTTEKMGAPTAPPFISYPAQKKSALPWILGIAGLLVIGIIVTVVLVSKSSGGSGTSGTSSVTNNSSTPTSSPTTTPNSQSWETLNADKFNVSMPGTPSKSDQTQTTIAGAVPVRTYTLDKGSEAYIVAYSEYPSAVFNSENSDTILNGARDGAVNNVHGQVLSERPLSQGSYVGREITGKAPDQNFGFTIHLYLANPRMYMLIYLKQGDQPITDDGRKFLDSFKITSP
jgi:hypothetical protein